MTELARHPLLEAWLAERLGARNLQIASAGRLSGGAIQENWRLDLEIDGHPECIVLRRDAPAAIIASRSRAEEFALVTAAHTAGVRVPRPIGFCDDPGLIGAPFAALEYVAGTGYGPRVVRDESLGGDRTELGHELGRQLARIHAIRPEPLLARLLGPRPADPAAEEIARLRRWLDHRTTPRPGLEWGLRWAERHAPEPDETVLAHRDFRTGNYLVDETGLTAILDWEFAGWCDPSADLGWFCAECWRFSRPDRTGGGVCDREDFYFGYKAESGRKIDPDRVRWWELMAHLRWAVIALQQGDRHAGGAERSLHLALTGRIADTLEHTVLKMTAPVRSSP